MSHFPLQIRREIADFIPSMDSLITVAWSSLLTKVPRNISEAKAIPPRGFSEAKAIPPR